jgi:N6-adenosine-specific RNA methylase IME4
MANPFVFAASPNQSGLVYDMIEVTTNDSTDNVGDNNVAIGLYIETGGDVVFLNVDGNERTVQVPDNFYLTCSVKRVKASGTTATGIHALVV